MRSSKNRKEVHLESMKQDIENGREILARFLYEKKFVKIEWFSEINGVAQLLCDDWVVRRHYDIMETKVC